MKQMLLGMTYRPAVVFLAVLIFVPLPLRGGTPDPPFPLPGRETERDLQQAARPDPNQASLLLPSPGLAFGIGYAVPNLADEYAPLGAYWAKLAYKDTRWNTIEPDPPDNGVHTYQWDDLDALIAEYQANGFREIHLTVEAKSNWGSRAGCAPFACKPSPPKPEHWDDYLAYVRAVIERYDGDGVDDMPGLLYPVRTFEVESEADALWEGTVEEYLALLGDAVAVIKGANPEAQISPAAIYFYGLFAGRPDAAEMARRLAERPRVQAILDFDREVLRYPDRFDFVQFHDLGTLEETEGTAAWLRAEMAAEGYQKPVWATDVISGPPLIPMGYWGYPYDREQARHYLDVIKENIVAEEPTQEYRDIMAWYRAEQARFAVKRLLVGIKQGLEGMLMGPLEDWPHMFCIPYRPTPSCPECPYNFYSWAVYGMYEIDHGPLRCLFTRRDPLAPYPVFYSLQLVLGKLAGATEVEWLSPMTGGDREAGGYADGETRGQPGTGRRGEGETRGQGDKEVYAYRVLVEGRPVYVLWVEDGVGQMVGEVEPSVTLTLPVAATAVTVTHIITETGQTDPVVKLLPAVDGAVHLTVGETPLFVEGDTTPCPRTADFDCDGEVTVADIMAVATHWNARLGGPGYAADFDLDRDGDTDVVDVMRVARRWGVLSG